MPEISDAQLETLLCALSEMPVPSFYPSGAREANAPYIERHHVAFGDIVYSVWHSDLPIATNLDASYIAADEYLDYLDDACLTFHAAASLQSQATD